MRAEVLLGNCFECTSVHQCICSSLTLLRSALLSAHSLRLLRIYVLWLFFLKCRFTNFLHVHCRALPVLQHSEFQEVESPEDGKLASFFALLFC